MKNLSTPSWLREMPNQLTLFRIALCPLILFLYPIGPHSLKILCAALFAIASITDMLDGYVARRFKLESRLGAILDPIADKILTGVGLILITQSGAIWAWMTGLILARELGINGLRLVAQDQGLKIPVNLIGKFKMFFLDIAIVCLLVNEPLFGWPFQEVGMITIWLALFCALYSAWQYASDFWRQTKSVF